MQPGGEIRPTKFSRPQDDFVKFENKLHFLIIETAVLLSTRCFPLDLRLQTLKKSLKL